MIDQPLMTGPMYKWQLCREDCPTTDDNHPDKRVDEYSVHSPGCDKVDTNDVVSRKELIDNIRL